MAALRGFAHPSAVVVRQALPRRVHREHRPVGPAQAALPAMPSRLRRGAEGVPAGSQQWGLEGPLIVAGATFARQFSPARMQGSRAIADPQIAPRVAKP